MAEAGAHAPLVNRPVRRLLAAEVCASAAGLALITTLGWQGYSRSHEAIVLGLLGLAQFIPALVLAIPAGHAADRHDRRRVGQWGMSGLAVVAFALALDAAAGDREVWPLYLLALCSGVAQAFVAPAFNPLLAAMSRDASSLARLVALSALAWQSASIGGPAIAGLLNAWSDPAPYLACGVLLLAAVVLLGMIPEAIGTAHVEGEQADATLREALAGVRLIARSPALLGAISLDLAAVLFGGATALLPIFASDVLHVGALGNGFLRAAPGVGAVVVGLVLAVHPLSRRVGPVLFGAVALFGVFTVIFGLSRSYVLSLVTLALLAGADMVSVLIRATLGPLFTPPDLRGRVGAVEHVFIGASNELGAFESGVAAALLGAVPAVIIGGALSIVVAVVWAWRFPQLRTVDRFDEIRPIAPK